MALAYLVILLAIPYKLFEILLYALDFVIFAPYNGIKNLFEKAESFFE